MWHIKPFHDDLHLQGLVANLMDGKGIKGFIETGTFRGDTLRWMARRWPKILMLSCEENPLFAKIAQFRLLGFQNAKVLVGLSDKILPRMLRQVEPPVLFWLDGHTETYSPIIEELRAIKAWGKQGYILIDDFQVPQTEFGCNWARLGKPLNLDFLKENGIDIDGAKFPDYEPRADWRGWMLLRSNIK